MLHGLFENGQTWIATGPEEENGKAIPYQLADKGYDVWLLSYRGTHYSREHLWLSPNTDIDFWDYSFEEFGKFDLKASIEFIQKEKKSH